MAKPALRIWSNVKYHDSAMQLLRDGTGENQLMLALEQTGTQPAEVEIAFGQPDPQLVKRSTTLRWIHLSSAGYDKFDTEEMRDALRARNAILTTSSAVYCEPCAQHLLAMMMGLARRLPEALEIQRGKRSWPTKELRAESYLLSGQTALILGYGAIAQRLAELLEPFRMKIVAVRRRITREEAILAISESEIEKYLPQADHVINTLPSNAGTRRFVNAERISLMKQGAKFYNVGRGNTVDQEALIEALNSGHLAAAYLDVIDPEPPPTNHPVWTTPNCFITPHSAGGHIGEEDRLVRHFLENLRRLSSGDKLLDRVI